MLHFFDREPQACEVPSRFPNPFDDGTPHPLAVRAADALKRTLASGYEFLDVPGGGKMFGVLVVACGDGRVGFLAAFSGMLGGRWHMPGFVPPLFDEAGRSAFWPAGEAELTRLAAAADEAVHGPVAARVRQELRALDARQAAEMHALRVWHGERRTARRAERARGDDALDALAQQSRADRAARKALARLHEEARADLAARVRALDEESARLEALRAQTSRALLAQLWDTYVVTDARGHRRSLASLFAPNAPPGGAGDCAAPKLIGHAHALGVRPLALAELWWGASPVSGARRRGAFYPACRQSCGVILPHMLGGILLDAPVVHGAKPIAADQPRVLFEDEWLVVVDKPCGLLSVPGRHAQLTDAVSSRLRARFPAATGPLIAHRLDLDTSGILLACKDLATHAAVQRQFAERSIEKRYVAWVDGEVARDQGVIELALRVDVDDRPRQIYDPAHGRSAVTAWRVLERQGARTKVALYPRTGRTHQLRVHAAHPLGLGAPIVGDRLYGTDGERLMLHADRLTFTHPHTGERLTIECPSTAI